MSFSFFFFFCLGYFTQPGQIPQTGYNTPVMQPQQPQGVKERKKKILRIQDPTSGEDLTESIMRDSAVGAPVNSQVTNAGSASAPSQVSPSSLYILRLLVLIRVP